MPLLLPHKILTAASALFCLAALIVLVLRTRAAGKNEFYSAPRTGSLGGVVYAFGRGMMPWEKESAGLHLPTFLGGILYHGAIFLALAYILWIILLPGLPRPHALLRPIFAAGAAVGLALLAKRVFSPQLRRLSCADDFLANLFVDLLLLLCLLHTYAAASEPALLLTACALFVYIPFGKIRHCFFFFYTRILFGVFFGRRGVFPHRPPEA